MVTWIQQRGIFVFMLFCMIFFCMPRFVLADTVTDAYDQPSSIVAGEASNHAFSITLADAVAEGETVTITFPTAFDTSGIDEDDIDIEDDDTDLTTAADCSGSEEASIAIASDIVTITICAGDGGAIASGSVLDVEIGLNAAASGTGATQITNPSTAGTYLIGVGGTFGGAGSIPVPIISSSSGSVSATVPSAGGGGGGGGGGSPEPVSHTIEVLRPNGGEVLSGGSEYTITWSTGSSISSIDLAYSTDNGASYTTIATGEANDGSYEWTLPNIATTQALVRIEGTISGTPSTVRDYSDDVFTITYEEEEETYELVIVQPNGGEEIAVDSAYDIQWTSSENIGFVSLYFQTIAGEPLVLIADLIENDGSYAWTTPSDPTDSAVIIVEGYDRNGVYRIQDESDAVFSLIGESGTDDDTTDTDDDVAGEDDNGEDDTTDDNTDENGDTNTNDDNTGNTEENGSNTEDGDNNGNTDDNDTGDVNNQQYQLDAFMTVLDDAITIPNVGDIFTLFVGSDARIYVDVDDMSAVDTARFTYGSRDITPDRVTADMYVFDIVVPTSSILFDVDVSYKNGEDANGSYRIQPQGYGMVQTMTEDGTRAVEGAVLLVYEGSARGTQWPAAAYGQNNPSVTGVDGLFGWYVPGDVYTISIGKSGFEDDTVTVRTGNRLLTTDIVLAALEEDFTVTEDNIDEPTKTENVISALTERIDTIRELPEVKTTADIARIATVTSLVSGVVILSTSFSLLPWLQYLFTAPFLFFARRKREQFGIVYNALTKVPIDLAIVRILTEKGRLAATAVTDTEGRYFIKVKPGRYTIEVKKEGFVFPSVFLAGKRVDGDYLDVYTGGIIEVTEDDVIVAANIPLDPSSAEKYHAPRAIIFRRFLRVLQYVLAITGLVLSVVVFIVYPSLVSLVMVIVQILALLITYIVLRPKKRKGWGIVYDTKTHAPLANTVIRLFESHHNKLIETAVTDRKGRYAFFAGANAYYLTSEKDGYKTHVISPIDYKEKREPEPITVDIEMKKGSDDSILGE